MNESLDFCYIPNCMLKKNQKKTTVEIEKIRDTKKAFIQRCSDAQRHYTINAEQTRLFYSAKKRNNEAVFEHSIALGKKYLGRLRFNCSEKSMHLPLSKEPQKSTFLPIL